MSNTVYIKLSNGAYKKVTYVERTIEGKLQHIDESLLTKGKDGESIVGERGLDGRDGRDGESIRGERGEVGYEGPQGPQGLPGISAELQLRFITDSVKIKPGQYQVVHDMFIINQLTVEAADSHFRIGGFTVSNDALLNIKKDLTIDGSLNVYGVLVLD